MSVDAQLPYKLIGVQLLTVHFSVHFLKGEK